MNIPKYQWLIEEQTSDCGFCDKLYLDENFEKKFQVNFTPEVLIDEDFDGAVAKPLDNDGEVSTTYIFDMSYAPATQAWVNTFTFLEDGVEKSYIIVITADNVPPTGRVTEYGNITLIEIDQDISLKANYAAAVNVRLPDGITATVNGDNIEIDGLPVGTQIIDTPNYPTVSGITDPAVWSFNNFVPVENKACFFNISDFDEIDTPTTTPSIYTDIVVTANHRIIVTVNFTNSFGFDVDLNLVIREGDFSEVDTVTKLAEEGTNTLTFCWLAPGVVDPYYIFDLVVSDHDNYTTSIFDSTTGFCFNTVKIEEIGYVDEISYKDCDEVEHVLGVEDWQWAYSCGYNYLIYLTSALDSVFQLTITGSDGDTFTSMWYETIDPTTCHKGKIFRLRWTDDCQVGDIDYADEDLTLTNELYVTGVLIKTPLENVETVTNITSSGKKKRVYSHTIETRELRLHPYSEQVQSTLERVFEHGEVYIDDDRYYTDGEGYVVSELDMGIYTGRVDLLLDDSELIKSSCCC